MAAVLLLVAVNLALFSISGNSVRKNMKLNINRKVS